MFLEKELGTAYPRVDSEFGYMESHSFLLRLRAPGLLFLTELGTEVSKAKQKKPRSNILRKIIHGCSLD